MTLFTPLRRHPDAYYTSCTTKIELNKPFRTTLEIDVTFTKLGTVTQKETDTYKPKKTQKEKEADAYKPILM